MSGLAKSPYHMASTVFILMGMALSASPVSAVSPAQPSEASVAVSPAIPLKISQAFKAPKRGSAPPSAGGATRGETCLKNSKQFTSLIPQSRIGLTASKNPTFYWYLPKSPATTARFLLLGNDDTDVVYETTLALPNKPGVVSFKLPETAPALEVDKQYHWYLIVKCSQTDQSANPSVEGWVERIQLEPTLSSQLDKADLAGQAKLLADNGVWYDALQASAQFRNQNAGQQKAEAAWAELLRSVGLGEIAKEPLLRVELSKK